MTPPRASAGLMADKAKLTAQLRDVYLARNCWVNVYHAARQSARMWAEVMGSGLDPQGIGQAAALRDAGIDRLDTLEDQIRTYARRFGIALPTREELEAWAEGPAATFSTHAPELRHLRRRR